LFQTTTRAGLAAPGNACCIRIAASTVGTLRGRLSVTAASCGRMPNAGSVTITRASVAVPPHSSGCRTTACATEDQSRDWTAVVRRGLSQGMRPAVDPPAELGQQCRQHGHRPDHRQAYHQHRANRQSPEVVQAGEQQAGEAQHHGHAGGHHGTAGGAGSDPQRLDDVASRGAFLPGPAQSV
jgi:hypothetical protein